MIKLIDNGKMSYNLEDLVHIFTIYLGYALCFEVYSDLKSHF